MKKGDIIQLRVAHLHRKLHEAEKMRIAAIAQVSAIKDRCMAKEILYSEYEQKLSEKIDGLSLPEWVEYYEGYVKACESHICALAKDSARMF